MKNHSKNRQLGCVLYIRDIMVVNGTGLIL